MSILQISDLLRGLEKLGGSDYRINPAAPGYGRELLRGQMQTLELRPGLVLYCTEVEDLCTLRSSNLLRPGIKITWLLRGESELAYGPQQMHLRGSQQHGEAVVVALTEEERFTRHWQLGRSERKLNLTLSTAWLASNGLDRSSLNRFISHHLACRRWQPSARAYALAQQLLSPPPLEQPLLRLWQESRCLDIAVEALSAVGHAATVPVTQVTSVPRGYRRLCELRDFLDSGQADGLSLAAIARHAGMSTSHLQRHFAAVAGTSVVEYLRLSRLERAREALRRGDIDVAAAAGLAGYRTASNFSTAFRKQFGVTPRQIRSRI